VNPLNYLWWTIIILLLLLLGLLWCESAAAQVEDMAHPVTKEPGAWIPHWVQQDHLKLEADLKTCQEADDKRVQALEKKDVTITDLRSALAEGEKAKKANAEVVKNVNLQLEKEKETSETLRQWLYGTSGVAVAAVILTIVIAL